MNEIGQDYWKIRAIITSKQNKEQHLTALYNLTLLFARKHSCYFGQQLFVCLTFHYNKLYSSIHGR